MGCSVGRDNPTNDFPSGMLMVPQDLPRGWTREDVYFEDVLNAQSVTVAHVGSSDPKESHILVSHQLSLYQTETDAKNAYSDWESEWFTTDKLIPPNGWLFQPQDTQDQSRFGCLNQTINEKPFLVCRYLQRHKSIISLVLANLDGETLTLEQFANTLMLIDTRMNQ